MGGGQGRREGWDVKVLWREGGGGLSRRRARDNKKHKEESKHSPEQVIAFAEGMPKLK